MADLTAMLQAAAGNAGGDANFIEDVFSCFLYTGNGSTQTITNGIDLAGEGGLVWIHGRSAATIHKLTDTVRGVTKALASERTLAQATDTNGLTAFSATGFSVGSDSDYNGNATTYVGWTFREQPKFFDVVTYTGDGVAGRTVPHNLGSVPGSIIVKKTSSADAWAVYHRGVNSDTGNGVLILSSTAAQNVNGRFWWGDNTNFIAPTATEFTVATDGQVNESGATYVAYLFAHNAGGFGLTGTDNVISCGSYTGTGATGNFVNLGYEPQWVMTKRTNGEGNWNMEDIMRGMPVSGASQELLANSSFQEQAVTAINVTSTGFQLTSANGDYNGSGNTYIYIAIRRGPMKVPTDGTSVFAPVRYTTSPEGFITGFPVDFGIAGNAAGTDKWYWQSRLQGAVTMSSASTAAEAGSGSAKFDMMNGYGTGFSAAYYANALRRAPGFFDVVCYTGTGANRTVTHNLTVAPELMIVKGRTNVANWSVYSGALGSGNSLSLNTTQASFANATQWIANPTASVFSVGTSNNINGSGLTYVAYLFASCPDVSRVGSYTGTGTTQVINCGFTAGSRFVMIKRTDSTGSWYVWDSSRGIVAGNDPYLLLNSTAAEVTNTDFVDTASVGFEISSTAPAEINASGGTYIFLAIA